MSADKIGAVMRVTRRIGFRIYQQPMLRPGKSDNAAPLNPQPQKNLFERAPRSEAAAGAKRTVGRSDCHLLWPASEYTQIGKFGPEHHAGWFGAWVSWLGDSSTVEQRTLTPSILVRIQVPQPGILLKSRRICSFLARRNRA